MITFLENYLTSNYAVTSRVVFNFEVQVMDLVSYMFTFCGLQKPGVSVELCGKGLSF